MISIFNGGDITPPSKRNIHTFKKRLHEVTVQLHSEERQLEELQQTLGSLRPLTPMGDADGRDKLPGEKKLKTQIASLRDEKGSLEILVDTYEREHPGLTREEQERTLLSAQVEQQRRYYTDAQLDVAAGNADAVQLDAIREELAAREQRLIDFDEAQRQKAERSARLATVVPGLRGRLLDHLAAFDQKADELQRIVDDLRVDYAEIDALKDAQGRVPGIRGELLALALPFEAVYRWNYDKFRPVRLFDRWRRAFASHNVKAA